MFIRLSGVINRSFIYLLCIKKHEYIIFAHVFFDQVVENVHSIAMFHAGSTIYNLSTPSHSTALDNAEQQH